MQYKELSPVELETQVCLKQKGISVACSVNST